MFRQVSKPSIKAIGIFAVLIYLTGLLSYLNCLQINCILFCSRNITANDNVSNCHQDATNHCQSGNISVKPVFPECCNHQNGEEEQKGCSCFETKSPDATQVSMTVIKFDKTITTQFFSSNDAFETLSQIRYFSKEGTLKDDSRIHLIHQLKSCCN